MTDLSHPHVSTTTLPTIRRIAIGSCLTWLRLGLADLRAAWAVSLAHGALFAGLGWLLVSRAWSDSHWGLVFTSGFLLVAPFLATCFYAASRAVERGEPAVSLRRPFRLLRDHSWSLGLFAFALASLFSLWERTVAIAVGLTLNHDIYSHGDKTFSYVDSILRDPAHLPVVIAFFAVGALFALAAFAISAVALPMIIDRDADPVTAGLTSLAAVRRNPLAMLAWAAMIVLLVGIGYFTVFIGLVVIFPWLGHATWHAYRGLVESDDESAGYH
jgi:uncharacterized membrane protein